MTKFAGKFTPFFDSAVTPAHEGVYRIKHSVGKRVKHGFSYWSPNDGWRTMRSTPNAAQRRNAVPTKRLVPDWRGLRQPSAQLAA